jgi:poly-gamma-glutamate synthesis protein (capsule biosynthesis protein)
MAGFSRREFLHASSGIFAACTGMGATGLYAETNAAQDVSGSAQVTLFLCGDVMTGRGIDQVLPHPGDPRIYESYMKSATGYVEIAESDHGPIPRPVAFEYIWGDALAELHRVSPDLRVINLETSITASGDHWRGKGINYRMHPANVPCLTVAGIDCCTLANNHVLDWGYAGLEETLHTLHQAGVATAGAGRDLDEAGAPAILPLGQSGRLLVFSLGSDSAGIPPEWAASVGKPGVNFLADLSSRQVQRIARSVHANRGPGDIAMASLHWGGNWGYAIPGQQREFARALIDEAGIDIVHGHSSHHPKGIEIYRNRPIIYGCGDLINDYEGIPGHREYRGDLSLMYFPVVEPGTGTLSRLDLTPMQIRHFRLNRANEEDSEWLAAMLSREGAPLGSGAAVTPDQRITLSW